MKTTLTTKDILSMVHHLEMFRVPPLVLTNELAASVNREEVARVKRFGGKAHKFKSGDRVYYLYNPMPISLCQWYKTKPTEVPMKIGSRKLKMSDGSVRTFKSGGARNRFERVAMAVKHGWKPTGRGKK